MNYRENWLHLVDHSYLDLSANLPTEAFDDELEKLIQQGTLYSPLKRTRFIVVVTARFIGPLLTVFNW
jgi:hypothetical protein